MDGTIFQKLQGLARRHLWLVLSGAALPCGGCISCTGFRSDGGSHIEDSLVTLSSEQQAALRAYTDPRIPSALCEQTCPRGLGVLVGCYRVQASASPPEEPQLACSYRVRHFHAAGRRPAGLQPGLAAAPGSQGEWLAESARLEAAAVHAFVELHAELARLGAPPPLLAACLDARDDEVRHARVMTRLARAAGAEPEPPAVVPAGPRPLWELARDNAIEGCVRESFGALEALWQSYAAADPELRRVLAAIAEDEARHARLALALDAWLQDRLEPQQRRAVQSATRAACDSLSAELLARPPMPPELGLLCGASAAALFRETLSVLGLQAAEG